MIAVTGAGGEIGGGVARALVGSEHLRLVVRSRAPELDAEVAFAEYRDGAAMRAAFSGADSVFLVSASESRDRVAGHFSAVDAAVAAGVRRIVYLSFMGAAADAVFTFARDHAATEERILASGVDHTFLRSCMYADFVPALADPADVIRGPAGKGRVAWVARDDVADVAAAVLAGSGHSGRVYDSTGPAALTMEESASVLSEAVGRSFAYAEETLEQARESRRPSGHPEWEIEGWVTSYAQIAEGVLERVSDTVQRIAGHPPRSLRDVLREHPESYAHLRR